MNPLAALRQLRHWLVFSGGILCIFVLAKAAALFVPIVIAVLIAFLLAPLASNLQRRIGRIPAVMVIALTCIALVVALGLFVFQEMTALGSELASYRSNIRAKIADVRGLARGGVVEQVDALISDVSKQLSRGVQAPPGGVVLEQRELITATSVSAVLEPALGWLANAAVILVLAAFMLLERQQLRDRIVRMFGHTQLATTTRAIDDAGSRISRYLYAQLLVNTFYGAVLGVGLHLMGIPHAPLWGALAAILRFVPYIGPWIAAIPPILLSMAVAPDWAAPVMVVGLFLALELFTNLFLETYFYAGVAGISQVGLLIAILFWSWLWGMAGLLLAAPLTVCLVVLGRHVGALSGFSELLTDQHAEDLPGRYYQRLLAGDRCEASEILIQYEQSERAATHTVYDTLMLPALSFAQRDVAAGVLDLEEEKSLQDDTVQLLDELIARRPLALPGPPSDPLLVLAFPANGGGDALALRMLADVMMGSAIQLEIGSASSMYSEIIQLIQTRQCSVICIAHLPPNAPHKARYLTRRLRAALPALRIIIGRWAPTTLANDSEFSILEAGADHVCSTLEETRLYLCQLGGLQLSAAGVNDANA